MHFIEEVETDSACRESQLMSTSDSEVHYELHRRRTSCVRACSYFRAPCRFIDQSAKLIGAQRKNEMCERKYAYTCL